MSNQSSRNRLTFRDLGLFSYSRLQCRGELSSTVHHAVVRGELSSTIATGNTRKLEKCLIIPRAECHCQYLEHTSFGANIPNLPTPVVRTTRAVMSSLAVTAAAAQSKETSNDRDTKFSQNRTVSLKLLKNWRKMW